ncbi:MAG TPA: class I SAM-dependent methyltransferase [Acidimicrobiales bacterium]|nr:class I SAM-dependent methyltransferase [Acidimicrobiales bacterium]
MIAELTPQYLWGMGTDDAYGTRKRIDFVSEVIAEMCPATVLDIGCGTGNQLTKPLAERFQDVLFLGVDSDEATIAGARQSNVLPNLSFGLEPTGTFDLIIASEVMEHVIDPVEFLRSLRNRLATGSSRVVVTVPNGFGPFEIAAAVERTLHGPKLGHVSRAVSGALRRAKHIVVGAPDLEAAHARANTFADSPHVNFFSRSDVEVVAGAAGFAVERQRSRTLVCGYGFDRVVKGRLAQWNCALADALPSMSSGWMFVLKQGETRPGAYVPGRWATWKRKHLMELHGGPRP